MSIESVKNSAQLVDSRSSTATDQATLITLKTKKESSAFIKYFNGNEVLVGGLLWSFLTPKEVGLIASVSRSWKEMTNFNFLWKGLYDKRNFLKDSVTTCNILYKELYQAKLEDLFSNKLGKEFYSKYFGDVEALSIPQEFVEKANEIDPLGDGKVLIKDNYQLVFVPSYIKIIIPPSSHLTLNAKGRLVKRSFLYGMFESQKTFYNVPLSLNNLVILAEEGLKKNKQTLLPVFEESYATQELLACYGDEPVVESHWSYQRKEVVGLNLEYSGERGQKALVRDNKLELVFLMDRVLCNFGEYIRSEKFLDHQYRARTSKVCYESCVIAVKSCERDAELFGFDSSLDSQFDSLTGVAVQIPAAFH